MTAWYVVLLALIVTAIGAFVVLRLRADLVDAIDASLRPAAGQIAADYGAEGNAGEFRDSARGVLKGERAAAQLLTPDWRVVVVYGDPVAERPMASRSELRRAMAGASPLATRSLGGDDFRLTARRVDRQGRRYVVVAGQSLEPAQRSVRRLVTLLLIALPAALFLTALGGWWLARRALRPVGHMATTAAAIDADRLDERVPEPHSRDELAHLAQTLNGMLDRIRRGVGEQRRLIADASHELRTPLAAMRAEIDVSLRADSLSPAARDVLLSTRDEVDRLGRTVDDLLTLATADEGGLSLRLERVDLAEVASGVVGVVRPLAARRGVELVFSGSPAGVVADPARMGQAIRNVLENALEFSPAGAPVTVDVIADGETARCRVTDGGPGIPEGMRERVFDRFFRADPSRTRITGGSGLGLAIVREIVASHGGTVRVVPGGHGTAIAIELPSAGPAAPAGDGVATVRRIPAGTGPS
jgi:heavy metal sensor kinase